MTALAYIDTPAFVAGVARAKRELAALNRDPDTVTVTYPTVDGDRHHYTLCRRCGWGTGTVQHREKCDG